MNSGSNAIDFVVAQKKEGKYLVLQILSLFIMAFAIALPFVILAIFKIPGALIAIMGVGLAVPLFLIAFHGTRTLHTFDRKYSIFTTNVTMDQVPQTVISFEIVKDKKKKDPDKRDVVYERPIKEAVKFAPWTAEYKSESEGAKKVIDFRSSVKKTEDVYFAKFTEKDGSSTVIIFEAVNKIVDKLAYYNKEATVVVQLSR